MALEKIYEMMDSYPFLFLIPPLLIFIFIDLYYSMGPLFLTVFPITTLVFTHFYLVFLKALFKKERKVESRDDVQKYAFPSYHTGMATCFCAVQGLLLPLTAPIMAALVLVTAVGRVKLNRHDWKDVTSAVALVLPVVVAFYLLTSFCF